MDKHRADNNNSGHLQLWYLHTIFHYNCRDASFKNCGQAQTGIAQGGENRRTTPARETTPLGYSWKHLDVRGELRIYILYHYTYEEEWMISSSPAGLLQSWNIIKTWTQHNAEEDWIKKQSKSLSEILSLLLSLVWFCTAWLSYFKQLWELMHFPALGTFPKTTSFKPNWPKIHWFYNTQTNKDFAVTNHQQVSPETIVIKDLCYYGHS